jgi:hypothetical protein
MAPPRRGRSADKPARPSMSQLAVEDSLSRLSSLNVDGLRAEWKSAFGSPPPAAFSKDLLARAIAYCLQAQELGDLDKATTRLLQSLRTDDTPPPRQVKVGSVIVREHKGVVHEVVVVPGGFCWHGKTYDSLSTIAKKITGITWNGPRFFGLRSKREAVQESSNSQMRGNASEDQPSAHPPRGRGRRSSLRGLARPREVVS